MGIPVFIDTDIGTDVDDAIALIFGTRCPEISIIGVGTVAGNVMLRSQIAQRLLGLLNAEHIPVATGCSSNLLRTATYPSFGHEGKGILERKGPDAPLYSGHAIDLLVETIKQSTQKIVIVAIGPMTNIALAFIKEPWIIEKIERLYIMGGSVFPQTLNSYLHMVVPELIIRKLENNFNVDPEAADVVLRSGVPITLIPIEITVQTFLTDEELAILSSIKNDVATCLHSMISIWIPILQRLTGQIGAPNLAKVYLHDPLTVAAVVQPGIIHTKPMFIYSQKKEGVFCTMTDPIKSPNMEVAVSVDAHSFHHLIMEKLTKRNN